MTFYIETYKEIHKKFGEIIEQSLSGSNAAKHGSISSFYQDYNNWIEIVGVENEQIVLREAIDEYKTMLLFLCMGLYKNAYMSLRGYFELTLFAVLLSKSDMDFRLWKNGLKDVHWSEITDLDKGLFSEMYVSMYNDDLLVERISMQEKSKSLYRRCSEYIHSGYHVVNKDEDICFEQATFDDFCKDVEQINRIITYCFCVRYKDNIMKNENKTVIGDCIHEQLKDIQAIHKLTI